MEELFRPPAAEWRRLSPNFLKLKFTMIAIVWPVMLGLLALGLWLLFRESPAWWIALAVGVVWIGWRLFRAPRAFRRWGYAETDDDVYLTHGLWWRQLTCVPYGRMQLVNVSSGPIERSFGLASVQMVTSSTSGTILIPGLTADDAAALRDRLVERGELLQAGI